MIIRFICGAGVDSVIGSVGLRRRAGRRVRQCRRVALFDLPALFVPVCTARALLQTTAPRTVKRGVVVETLVARAELDAGRQRGQPQDGAVLDVVVLERDAVVYRQLRDLVVERVGHVSVADAHFDGMARVLYCVDVDRYVLVGEHDVAVLV